jgi:transcriptional antiterminator NusG
MDDEDGKLSVAVEQNMLTYGWFALQTLSNQESKVKVAIEVAIREQDLSDVIGEVLVPSERVVEVKNGRRFVRTRKFYPGYVFIKMRMYGEDGEVLHEVISKIRNISNVVRFVGDREPVELKQSEIDDILAKVQSASGKSVAKVTHEVGEMVKISDGPFLNSTGTVESIDMDQGRLCVNVSIFGRSMPVDLEFWQVKRFVDGEN